jgi:hypothetical protein
MIPIETDADNGTDIYQLTDDPRPTDNVYGEQPYASADGSRIAVRHYAAEGREGGLSLLDLADGSLHPIIAGALRFPAFHAWGDYLYTQEAVGDAQVLVRFDYHTLRREELLALPDGEGRYSYGTVSPDGRYYAVIVHPEGKSCRLLLFDLARGGMRVLAEAANQLFKHEQFSLDGRNRVLIQANGAEVRVVNLGAIGVDGGEIDWLPVDAPPLTPIGRWPGGERHTPRCTGHEAWIGSTDRVFLSTAFDEENQVSLWSAADAGAVPVFVHTGPQRFGHISVSRCGRYWIADVPEEDGVPIYFGTFGAGAGSRLLDSCTINDGKQWSHTHPYLTADNRWLIFTSSRSGLPQVYGARLQVSWLEEWKSG